MPTQFATPPQHEATAQQPMALVCLAAQATPPVQGTTVLAHAGVHAAHVLGLYLLAVDLAHYGQVDHLAPAGAMGEFTDYVQQLARDEAQNAFAPLQAALAPHSLPVEVHATTAQEGLHAVLRQLAQQYAQVVLLLPPGMPAPAAKGMCTAIIQE
ncbi:hypothetical protein [Desulfovibrio cuneatus]|uniref:hypothetical protein n=1 Tax=Desulfovibrio cuneatus TaxID=159728 RepID=UPI00041B2978|nr:hypothetical protein [Desulfovibrio cuneatus]